ncbi:MAG: glycosyltransferase [Ginsengibacter sp.]
MTSSPSVAVVILNWNGKHFLEKFLPSVVASDYGNISIIIADNASTDDSIQFIERNYPQLRIIKNELNEGFSKGYNTALKQVVADYYVLLNSDVEVESSWITPIISLMEKDKSIAACQPKILSYHQKEMFEYAGASGGWIDKWGYPFSRGRIFDSCEKDNGQYNDTVPIFWASGAALFVRAIIFNELNGFDEYFFAHQEEIDLCWRMQRAGYTIYVEPKSVVYHVGGGTLPMGSSKKVFLNFRNNLIMLSKNLQFQEAIYKIPFRIILDSVAAWQSLFKGDGGTFMAIVKAHMAFLIWIFSKKKNVQLPSRPLKNLDGVLLKSIVWEYFIQKRKSFSEILRNNNDI